MKKSAVWNSSGDHFFLNPHYWYVANQKKNNKQLNVVWNVDDLKISHVEDDAVEELISQLSERYGK